MMSTSTCTMKCLVIAMLACLYCVKGAQSDEVSLASAEVKTAQTMDNDTIQKADSGTVRKIHDPIQTMGNQTIQKTGNTNAQKLRAGVVEAPICSSVNLRLDPCNDFHEFVCDGWNKQQKLTDSDAKLTQFRTDDLKITDQMREFLEDRKRYYDDTHAAQLFFDMYDGCRSAEERTRLKSGPIFEALHDLDRAPNLTAKLIAIRPTWIFFKWTVDADMKNATMNRVTILPDQTYIGLSYYMLRRYAYVRRALKEYLRQVLLIMNEDDVDHKVFSADVVELDRRIESFFMIETALAKIIFFSKRHGDDNSAYYNLHSVDQVHKLAPNVNWRNLLLASMPEEMSSEVDLASMMVNIRDSDMISAIDSLIGSVTEQQLTDYMQWKVILGREKYLDSRFRTAKVKFLHVLYGTSAAKPLWYSCVGRVFKSFPDIATHYYVQHFLDKSVLKPVATLVDNVRDAFADLILENTWMDNSTKHAAKQKVRSMLSFVGFHEKVLNRSALDTKYANLHYETSWRYVDMIHAFDIWSLENEFRSLLAFNDRTDFDFPAPRTDAFYYAWRNHIALLPGILNGAFFNTSMPASLNYGGLGYIVGHEISHGFDNKGRQYDEWGNLHNWWDADTTSNFTTRKKCFVAQYGSVTVPNTNGMRINGRLTVDENIADNGGIRAAYRAMKRASLKDRLRGIKLKGLETFTEDQLFFMNSAYMWCAVSREKAVLDSLLTDSHSPHKYRVNIMMANQEEFIKAFKCSDNAPMMLARRCQLW